MSTCQSKWAPPRQPRTPPVDSPDAVPDDMPEEYPADYTPDFPEPRDSDTRREDPPDSICD